MIVRDIMQTHLITVAPDDPLSHAANLLRQYQFHHLPVVHKLKVDEPEQAEYTRNRTQLVFEGLLGSHDIELAVALSQQEETSGDRSKPPWQERRVAEFMHPMTLSVTPTTSIGSAAQLLLERGMSYLPVIDYGEEDSTALPVLVGMITRSDLLLLLARATGTFEPGMQVDIVLPLGQMTPLAKTLALADELRIHIRSLLAVPLEDGVPRLVALRLGTMNPAHLLERLKAEGIQYSFANSFAESEKHFV